MGDRKRPEESREALGIMSFVGVIVSGLLRLQAELSKSRAFPWIAAFTTK